MYHFSLCQVVELWDTRAAGTSSAATSIQLGPTQSSSVMDMELSDNRIVVACANKVKYFIFFSLIFTTNCIVICFPILQVLFLNPVDLAIAHEIAMPSPMTFKEEGGASLSPDGTKLLAVNVIPLGCDAV